jgi:succinate dehydrogenase flavin-adding protein (antitoxin of CptAB toxin-antitoxin module)
MNELLKKEIAFRGSRRGIKELDIILGNFIAKNLQNLSTNELETLKNILLESDLDLLSWFTEKIEHPYKNDPLFIKIKQNMCH